MLTPAFGARQTARNAGATGLAFAVSIGVGIWFTPFLVTRLGPESYGLVMLAVVVVSYAGPLAQTLSTSLAVAFAHAGADAANRDNPAALQTAMDRAMALSLRVSLILALLLVPLALGGPWLLGISGAFRTEAGTILLLTGLAFVVWVLGSPLSAILYAANRTDLGSYLQAAQNLVRVAGAVILIALLGWGSYATPVAALLGAAVALLAAGWACRTVSPLRLRYRRLAAGGGLGLRATGGSVLAYSVSTMLLLGTELLVVNYMASEAAAGIYAAVIQIPVLVRSAMLNLSSVFGPRVLALRAAGETRAAQAATADAMKLLGIMIALPAGVVLAAGPLVLEVWLGPAFAPYAPVLQLGMAGSVLLVAAQPLYALAIWERRVGVPAAIRGGAVAFYLIAAVVLFKATSLGLVSVAAGLAAALVLPELLVMAPYSARIGAAPLATFLKPFAAVSVAVGIAWVATRLVLLAWTPDTILMLCLFGAAVGAIHATACLALLDRAQVRGLFARIVARTPFAA